MKRLALILASTLLLTASHATAGELDSEFGGKAATLTPSPTLGTPSSELDSESPDQACHRRYGYRRFYGGFGYSRGYYGYGFGYGRRFGYGRYGW